MSASSPTTGAPRRTLRVLLSLVLLVLVPGTWVATLDWPFLRSTALAVWAQLGLALALALSAARADRRWWVRGVAGLQVAGVAFCCFSFFVLFREPETSVPERAVDFTLPDQDGHPITLADELRKGPVLLVFFRGHW